MACMNTLSENVYIAKLAVLTSTPRIWIMHWLVLGEPGLIDAAVSKMVFHVLDGEVSSRELQEALHGVVLSERSTPRSRAICSRVMGRNDPRLY